MGFVVKNEQKEFKIAPEGVHEAVCVDVVDLGIVESEKYGSSHKCRIVFEIDKVFTDVNLKGEKEVKNYMHSEWFTVSMHEKSKLRPFVESWLGSSFDDEVLRQQGFDLESLVGKKAQINIVHKPKANGDGKKAKINAIMPPAKGHEFNGSGHYTRVKDREDSEGNKSTFFGSGSDDDDIPF